jgi:peptide/nickel transport system permease protein
MRARVIPPQTTEPAAGVMPVTQVGVSQSAIVWRTLRRDRFALAGIAVVLLAILSAVFAPYLAPHDPYKVNSATRLLPPGAGGHLLGTDDIGRDTLSRLLWGGRISLWVAFFPVLLETEYPLRRWSNARYAAIKG